MVETIIQLLANISQAGINLAIKVYDATDTWQLVFAGISILLICRFILGPILGFTMSGASDIVRRSKHSKEE